MKERRCSIGKETEKKEKVEQSVSQSVSLVCYRQNGEVTRCELEAFEGARGRGYKIYSTRLAATALGGRP